MNTAGRGLQMNGFVAGPFDIGLGSQQFRMDMYETPIGDEMLLGIYFLKGHGIELNLSEGKLTIHGEVVKMNWGPGDTKPKLAQVYTEKTVMVPPNAVARLEGILSEKLGHDYVIEASTQGKLLVPRTLHQGNSNPIVCLINLTDWYVDVKEGSMIAEAGEVEVPHRS